MNITKSSKSTSTAILEACCLFLRLDRHLMSTGGVMSQRTKLSAPTARPGSTRSPTDSRGMCDIMQNPASRCRAGYQEEAEQTGSDFRAGIQLDVLHISPAEGGHVSTGTTPASSPSSTDDGGCSPGDPRETTGAGLLHVGSYALSCASTTRSVGNCSPSSQRCTSDEASAGQSATLPKKPSAIIVDVSWVDRGAASSPHRSTARMYPRRLWQPDNLADSCSMQTCHVEFGANLLGRSGRHHCRQCGRVVCASCSRGQKYLQSEDGKVGGKLSRVCNACMHGSETFNFAPSMVSRCDTSSPKRFMFSRMPTASSRTAGWGVTVMTESASSTCLNESASDASTAEIAGLTKSTSFNFLSSLLRSNSQTSVASAMSPLCGESSGCVSIDEIQANASDPIETLHMNDCPDGATMLRGGGVATFAVPPTHAAAVAEAAAEVAIHEPFVDARVTKLEAELQASSYYQGLLKHEPAALKALTTDLVCNIGMSNTH